jgi:hypothetical protein
MGRTMIRRAHTATRRAALDMAIAHRAGAAVAAYTQTHGLSAPTACAGSKACMCGHKFVQNATPAAPHTRTSTQHAGFEFVEVVADLVDQAADAADLFLRRHGLGACPLIEVGGGEQAFAGAQQVVEVGV